MALHKVREAVKAGHPLAVSTKTTPHTMHSSTAAALRRRGLVRWSLSSAGRSFLYLMPEGDAYFAEGTPLE